MYRTIWDLHTSHHRRLQDSATAVDRTYTVPWPLPPCTSSRAHVRGKKTSAQEKYSAQKQRRQHCKRGSHQPAQFMVLLCNSPIYRTVEQLHQASVLMNETQLMQWLVARFIRSCYRSSLSSNMLRRLGLEMLGLRICTAKTLWTML